MLIGVDFDGVIAEGTNQKILWAKEFLGIGLEPMETSKATCLPKFNKIKFAAPGGSVISGEALYVYMMSQIAGTSRTLGYQILPYCKEALAILMSKGHRICVVTSRGKYGTDSGWGRKFLRVNKIPHDNYHRMSQDDKRDFLLKHGFEVMIDDSYSKLVPLSSTGIFSLLFTTPWNASAKINKPDIVRVDDWHETLKAIDDIERQKIKRVA